MQEAGPERGNSQGVHFPWLGILPGTIDGKGRPGAQESRVIGRKRRIPTDGHPPGKDLMGRSAGRKPSAPRDGKNPKFPTIATPLAPELAGDAT